MKSLIGLIAAAAVFGASAKDTVFQPAQGGTDSWRDAANWSQGLPENGDSAKLLQQNVGSVTVDAENAKLTELTGHFNRTLSIKSNGGATELKVENLSLASANAEIAPDANMTVRVEKFAANGQIRNTGAGTIVVEKPIVAGDVDSLYQGRSNGAIVFAGKNTEPWAISPTVHLDASDASAFEYKTPGDPSSGVVRWNGVNGAGYAYHDLSVAPDDVTQVLPQRVEGVLNGMAVVDFGEWVNLDMNINNRAKGGYLLLPCGLNEDLNIYTAFIVETAKAFVFNAYDTGIGNIIHGVDSWDAVLIQLRNEAHLDFGPVGSSNSAGPYTGLGLTHLNGLKVDAWTAHRSGLDIYDTIGMRAETRPIHIGRLALDRQYRAGGAKIAEVILYDRKLTDEEFAATENYLRQKWQNADVTVVVPEVANVVPQLINASAKPIQINEGVIVEAELLDANDQSSARRAFTGGGTLKLQRTAAETTVGAETTVEVGNGVLMPVDGTKALTAPAANPIRDFSFHLDASVTESVVTNADGTVLEWRDVSNNGFAAVKPWNVQNKTYIPPRYVPALLNGKPGVDFGAWNSGMCLLWNQTNQTMRTLFVVYGTVINDQSFLIGNADLGNRSLDCAFHRGTRGALFYDNYTAAAIKTGDVRVNGKAVSWNGYHLSQEPCVLMLASQNQNNTMCGSAFAVDRWNGEGGRTGGQQICEVVAYDRILDDDEKNAVQDWLMAKWLPKTPAGYALKAGEEQFDEVRGIAAADEKAAIAVEEGTVRVGALSGANLAKTGAGTLTVGSVADMTGAVAVEAGTLEVAARELPADYELPGGYETTGAVAVNVRAVFAVYDLETAMDVPSYFQSADANDVTRVDGVRGKTMSVGVHVASVIATTRRATWNINVADSKLKELLVYTRHVTDLERRDIESYLARKWNVGALPGYAGAEQTLPALVAEGGTLRATDIALVVDSVSGSGTTTLDGEVTVMDAGSLAGSLSVPTGSSLTFSPKVGVTADTLPTEGLIARFDMSNRDSLTTVEENGKVYVTKWADLTGKYVATPVENYRPWIIAGDCNGLDVLGTGPYSTSNTGDKSQTGFMDWKTVDGKTATGVKARTVVEVIGVQEGGNFIVCANPGAPCLHRGGNTGSLYSDPLIAVRNETTSGGLDRANAYYAINGQRVNPSTTGFPSADYHSVAVRVDPDFQYEGEQTYFYVGQFGQDRVWRWGGQRICEFIAYDRVLSDDELQAIDAYLQKKWFNRNPGGYAAPEAGSLELAGGTVDLGGDARLFTSVSGTGTITGGQLNVTGTFAPDGLAISGTLNFAASGGQIVLPRLPNAGELVELGTAQTITGDWRSWTISPLPSDNSRGRLMILDGKLCVQVSGAPFIISIR